MDDKRPRVNTVDTGGDSRHGTREQERLSQQNKTTCREAQEKTRSGTYSTFFDHSGGLLKVMNTQLVKIVHIMIMLNTVEQSQGPTGHERGPTAPRGSLQPLFCHKTPRFPV